MRQVADHTIAFPGAGWQRVALAALLVIPLILVAALMTPAWVLWPFLPDNRRKDVRALVGQFIDWIKVAAGTTPPPRPELDHGSGTGTA
jgi:hypothetical protein